MTTAPTTWTIGAKRALERLDGRLFATVIETSAVLSYDRAGRTVRKAIEAGTIPANRCGGTFRVPVGWILQQVGMGTDGGGDDAA